MRTSRARALTRSLVGRVLEEQRAREHAHGVATGAAWPYERLSPLATSLATIRPGGRTAAVNLFLPGLSSGSVFAGVRTALVVAAAFSRELSMGVRVISETRDRPASARLAAEALTGSGVDAGSVEFVALDEVERVGFHEDDCWIATYWTTAHALDVACRAGLVNRARVAYLIQDYEPSFLAASTHQAVARSTYHARFAPVVNSAPLAQYLREHESAVTQGSVFAPELDLPRLREAALARQTSDRTRVMFYGRPSKPRNMFDLGISALRLAAPRMPSGQVEVRSVGERHRRFRLTDDLWLQPVGPVPWSSYFALLARTDVVVSLQATPHPSHPPLDAVASGARAVTNEVGGTRSGLHPRLVAVEPEPEALAEAVLGAMAAPERGTDRSYDDAFLSKLGDPIEDVVRRVARAIS